MDFMRENDIKVFVRGLRNTVDFEYERNLYNVYKSQDDSVEGCYFMASNGLAHDSASLVREILDLNGDVTGYIREEAAEEIK